MRENLYILLVMLLTVPIAGELKFHPFQDDFRISFGTTAFFFLLLWLRPSFVAGVLTGATVVLFRMMLDFMSQDVFDVIHSFHMHLPAFFFYATFAGLFSLFRVNLFHHLPLWVGLLGTAAEIGANLVELSFRSSSWDNVLQLSVIGPITAIALIRSFFVLSFFNIIQLRQAKWMEKQQRNRNERVLMLISNLYEESIHLKKTLHQVEDITRECYDLYRKMKEQGADDWIDRYSKQALSIAGQVHEVKKDNQRIYAGLSKLISDQNERDYMPMGELIAMIVRAQEKYARLLGKTIWFESDVAAPYLACHIYTTLSLVNNLVANAVEAIQDKGTVSISASLSESRQWIQFSVADDGPGIQVKDKELLFMPGFTTKYDVSGKPSTGIGLCYVKEVIDNLQGHIEISEEKQERGTLFIIRLPIASLVQKG
ncbi:sensor histidine kinase [Brevibacillus choshinensis]|uniref:sensor histidine kinase n=1 Tax=Brevibacillus choshinensis TaxID=54911 RepID=UPI002E21DB91|nr:sensor histidine kinase [Brevibacillus choshinensis]MED4782753.1 sensor histidine kinase [Brevibacillus choshinensis]